MSYAQESIFWGKNCPFGPNILTILRVKIFFVPTYQKTDSRHLVCIVILAGHGTKWARTANIWPKWPKMHILGKFDRCGAKVLFFWGGIKSFVTHVSENHLGTSFALFLVRQGTKWAKKTQHGQKGPTWPKMPILGKTILFFFLGGGEDIFWYPHIREPIRHLFCI